MNVVALFGTRLVHRVPCIVGFSRRLCDYSSDGDAMDNGFQFIEEPIKRTWGDSGSDSVDSQVEMRWSARRQDWLDAERVIEVLRQDGPGVDTKAALTELHVKVSWHLVREVLVGILRSVSVNYENKARWAKLGYKFFVWSGQQENYRHSTNSYNLIMKIFANCDEFMAMWRLVEEMTDNGFPTTARTFNILILTCREAGLARRVVDRFVQSKTFNYRPFKHSYNAILYSLLGVRHYGLIEWLYQKMLAQGLHPDVLTYNVVMCAKYRMGELGDVWRLVDEMVRNGFSPDFHTYNIILHALGKANKPLAAHKLLNHMREEGIDPCVLHYTTLMDGLSKAGNLEACEGFFDEMMKNGCWPDVVCYTVIIMGYVVAGELQKAEVMFDDMITKGQLPNVFTYNSMISGYCMAGKYKEACSMLNEMEAKDGREGEICPSSFKVNGTEEKLKCWILYLETSFGKARAAMKILMMIVTSDKNDQGAEEIPEEDVIKLTRRRMKLYELKCKMDKRRTKIVDVDPVEYNKMKESDLFYRDSSSLQYGKKIDRMVKELKDCDENHKSFGRRREFQEENDIDSINDRNDHFNKKIERAFGIYTLDIILAVA
ncbi:Pentatricopeptide repeat-containing protein At1g55630 [Linum perenne]